MLNIHDYNNQDCSGFEPALIFPVEELKQSALTVWPRRHFLKANNAKYTDTRSNNDITGKKIMNEL